MSWIISLKGDRDRRSSIRCYREQEVDDRLKGKWNDESSHDRSYMDTEVDDRQKNDEVIKAGVVGAILIMVKC